MDVRGTVALVTGGSSGIGRAVALRLAAAGATVVVHGRDRGRTEEVARLVGGTAVLGDLTAPGGPEHLAARALAVTGRLDLLVAAAGVGWSGPFTAMTDDEMRRVLGLDLVAPIALSRAVVPAMVSQGSGHLVLVSSVAGRTGVAGEAVYAAAKSGLDAFAESLRLELTGSGVAVSVVVPGAVRTPFFEQRGRRYDRRFPRQVEPDRVAAATLAAIRAGRPEVWVPRWLAVAPRVRALAPGLFRRLAARFGEQVRT